MLMMLMMMMMTVTVDFRRSALQSETPSGALVAAPTRRYDEPHTQHTLSSVPLHSADYRPSDAYIRQWTIFDDDDDHDDDDDDDDDEDNECGTRIVESACLVASAHERFVSFANAFSSCKPRSCIAHRLVASQPTNPPTNPVTDRPTSLLACNITRSKKTRTDTPKP